MEGSHQARRGASPSAGRSRHHPGVVGCPGCPKQGLIDYVEEEKYVPVGNTLVEENMTFLHQVIFFTNVCTKSYLLQYLHPVIFSQIFSPRNISQYICTWLYLPDYLHLVIISQIFAPSHIFTNICT